MGTKRNETIVPTPTTLLKAARSLKPSWRLASHRVIEETEDRRRAHLTFAHGGGFVFPQRVFEHLDVAQSWRVSHVFSYVLHGKAHLYLSLTRRA